MSQPRITPREMQSLQEALDTDCRTVNIRLREGEYQYDLAKVVGSFQLELYLPDVKDIVTRLYGEEKTSDVRFVRKIQTILKKLEKTDVVKILPKEKSWGLQRYVLSSFKFQDVDKNLVAFATDRQIKQMQDLLRSITSRQERRAAQISGIKLRIGLLLLIVAASYASILWSLMQPLIDPIIFVSALSVAVTCSLMLGKTLSQG